MMQDVNLVIEKLNALNSKENDSDENKKRAFWIHWLKARIIRQFHQNAWRDVHESLFEFKGKRKKKESSVTTKESEQKKSEANDETSSLTLRKRSLTIAQRSKKKQKRNDSKGFKNSSLLIYLEVCEKLKEKSICAEKKRYWVSRDFIFLLLFFFDQVDLIIKNAQEWQRLSYLRDLNRAMRKLKYETLKKQLTDVLRMLFDRYFLCFSSASRNQWIARNSKTKKLKWFELNSVEDRIDEASTREDLSWKISNRIDQNWCWDLLTKKAITNESVRETSRRIKDHEFWVIYERIDAVNSSLTG